MSDVRATSISDGRKRVLITGGAGRVGSAIRKHLGDVYSFRVLDVVPPTDLAPGDQMIVGNGADFATMLQASTDVVAIIHLMRVPLKRDRTTSSQSAEMTFKVDMPSIWCAFEAARINRVECVVYSSSNHVSGLDEEDGIVSTPDMAVRPDNIYGAGKAFGEALARYYADRMGVRMICLRLSNFNGKDEPGRRYEPGFSRWLSPRDVAQLVQKSIEAKHVPFGIFYGVSGGAEKIWDISSTRQILGYEPQDDGSDAKWRDKYLALPAAEPRPNTDHLKRHLGQRAG